MAKSGSRQHAPWYLKEEMLGKASTKMGNHFVPAGRPHIHANQAQKRITLQVAKNAPIKMTILVTPCTTQKTALNSSSFSTFLIFKKKKFHLMGFWGFGEVVKDY